MEPVLDTAPPAFARPPDTLDGLVVDIFEATGMKVTRDDPVVAAAFLQSRLLDDAAVRAGEHLTTRADRIAATLAASLETSRAHIEQVDRAMAAAFAQVAEGTRLITEQELLAVRASFARSAAETLDHVRRQATRRGGWRHWWRDPYACLVGAAFGLAAGCAMTLYWSQRPSTEEIRLIHNGLLLDAAWPHLTPVQRATIGNADHALPGRAAGGATSRKEERPADVVKNKIGGIQPPT